MVLPYLKGFLYFLCSLLVNGFGVYYFYQIDLIISVYF
jgi:hypothetical protein